MPENIISSNANAGKQLSAMCSLLQGLKGAPNLPSPLDLPLTNGITVWERHCWLHLIQFHYNIYIYTFKGHHSCYKDYQNPGTKRQISDGAQPFSLPLSTDQHSRQQNVSCDAGWHAPTINKANNLAWSKWLKRPIRGGIRYFGRNFWWHWQVRHVLGWWVP